ncbi:MAG: SDR family oxidoreductase [Deltaproteobacteria bacterium]|nr:SDR family oxidoreductase [Deltaproteobacteria bacterium]MBW2294631.1 SDR family oxidoreductase [Deltaproteobacteria bacterium]MBW2723664.1 SDR family oxidoreductase [Deltaproteobacteria bacterium]
MNSILDRFRLDDQVAIVTGSGRGIGAGTALAYADAGADVVVSARTVAQLEETAEKVRARGRRALVVECDVLDPEQRKNLVEKAVDEFGRIDILVNNAGGWPPKPTLDTTEDEFDACFRFNVTSAFAMTRLAVPKMVETAGSGAIVNISSVAGRFNARGFAAYGTAKSALSFLTRSLAQDFAPKVRVNGIAVGSILTDALAGFMTDDFERQMLAKTPMARLGQVEDIAACALYLASPAASYVTGEIYGVNGGLTQLQIEMPAANI